MLQDSAEHGELKKGQSDSRYDSQFFSSNLGMDVLESIDDELRYWMDRMSAASKVGSYLPVKEQWASQTRPDLTASSHVERKKSRRGIHKVSQIAESWDGSCQVCDRCCVLQDVDRKHDIEYPW